MLQGDLLLKRFGAGITSVGSLRALVVALAELGEFGEGMARGEDAVHIAEAAVHLFSLGQAWNGLGHLHTVQGDVERAIPVLQQGERIARDENSPSQLLYLAPDLGYVYLLAGRIADGLAILEQAVREAARAQQMRRQSLTLIRLGEGYLLAGRMTEAVACAERALALATQHGERGYEAYGLRSLGEITAHADPPDAKQAESYYREALALAEELGMRPLAAHCHLGLGILYRKVGRGDEARAELTTAAELYRAKEMTFWLEKAETELVQLGARAS